MLKIILLLILLVRFGDLKLQQLPDYEKPVRQSLTQCVLKAAENVFTKGETIVYSLPLSEVSSSQPSVTVLDRLLLVNLTSNWPILVKNVTLDQHELKKITRKPSYYIVQIRNLEEFIKNVDILSSYSNWNPHAKFLIISPTSFKDLKQMAEGLLKKLWQVHVVNAVVLLSDRHIPTTFNAYTWFPYENGNCGNNFHKVVLIDSCSFGEQKSVDWYPNKIPQKFNQCPIKVRMVEWPPYIINVPNASWSNSSKGGDRGLEVNLLDMIAESFNVSMFYYYSSVPLNWGDIYFNGTSYGNLRYLYQERDDIAIGAYAKTMPRSFMFDDTLYHQDYIRWCVPHSAQNTKLESISKIMSVGALSLTMLLYFTLVTLMRHVSPDEEWNSYKSLLGVLTNTFPILLGLGFFQSPKTFKMRLFMAMLMLYCFYLVSAYQPLLASALMSASYEEKTQTVEDILENNLEIYGLSSTRQYFQKHTGSQESTVAILKKWQNCDDVRKCLDHVAFTKSGAVCLPKTFTQFMLNYYRNQQNELLIYCFEKNIANMPLTILMRKGFPLYDRVNDLIVRIYTAGFILKWEKDLLRHIFLRISNINEKSGRSTLNWKSVEPIFLVWMAGCALSALTFLFEIVCQKIRCSKIHSL